MQTPQKPILLSAVLVVIGTASKMDAQVLQSPKIAPGDPVLLHLSKQDTFSPLFDARLGEQGFDVRIQVFWDTETRQFSVLAGEDTASEVALAESGVWLDDVVTFAFDGLAPEFQALHNQARTAWGGRWSHA